MDLIIKELKNIESVLLCKVNKKVIGELNVKYITEQTRSIDDIDTITLDIAKEYMNPVTFKKDRNPDYDNVIQERLLNIDDEYYVIKEITENILTKSKTVKAYGLEKKLEKVNITLSNIGLSLMDKDEENNVYSFNDELYKLTGWRLGYVENSVRYMETGAYKVRIQEDTDTSFYQFITETIRDQFCCIPVFDRKNKLVHLYDDDSFGDELKIVLTKDNYIKDLQKTSNSNDIVTRLKLKGNEEKCIVENATPTGYDYIENYSYFMQTHEMSDELIEAITLFEKITPDRMEEWKDLTQKKNVLVTDKSSKEADETISNGLIKQYEALIKEYDSKETDTTKYALDDITNKLNLEKEKVIALNEDITELSKQIDEMEKRIAELNALCRRETAKTFTGEIIFTDELLEELKDFTYYDTYSDDSFIDASELIKTGEKELERRCKPDIEWSMDSVDFLNRIIDNGYSQQWTGELGLGDVVALYDKKTDIEEYAYFVGWTKNYTDNTLTLEIANKKTKNDASKDISTLLKKSSNNDKLIRNMKHIINNQKLGKNPYEYLYDTTTVDVKVDLPTLIEKKKITELTFPSDTIAIQSGENYTLVPEITPDDATETELIWMSSDINVATVDDAGNVTGMGYGRSTISAMTRDGSFVAMVKCNVDGYYEEPAKVKVTNIKLSDLSLSMNIKGEYYLVASVEPFNATNKEVKFTSTDESIATVSDEGLISGVKAGTCKINVCSVDNPNVQSSCILLVNAVEDDRKAVDVNNAYIIGDDRVQLLKENKLIDKLTIDCKKGITATYFKDRLNYYRSDNTCAILMLGKNDLSSAGIVSYKELIKSVVDKYKSKKVYVVQELNLGVQYEGYQALNTAVDKFNNSISTYASSLGATVIDASDKLVTSGLLSSGYTDDGYNLNLAGNKVLWNNIVLNITNNSDDDLEEQKKDDTIIEDPKKEPEKPADKPNTDNKQPTEEKKNDTTTNKSDKRDKIVARAKEIVNMAKNKKAWYSQYNRTIDWNKKQVIKNSSETIYSQGKRYTYKQPGKGRYGFDCSSFVGVCYQAAGYDFMKGLSCAGGTLQSMAKKHGATVWRYVDDKSLKKAKPGDIVMWANDSRTVTKTNMFTVTTHHTGIYMGNGYVAEASGYTSGIKNTKRTLSNKVFFMRINELVKEDNNTSTKKPSATNNNNTTSKETKDGTNCYNVSGTIDGNKYIYKFTKARCTAYGGKASASASGIKMKPGFHCAAHNLAYGTKIYIPALKGKFGNKTGIYTVADTGGFCFDFDLFLATSDSEASKKLGSPINTTVYVLSWGTGRIASSFTSMAKFCVNYYGAYKFHTAWTQYMKYGGCTINFFKFNSTDKTFKNNSWYKKFL